MNPRNGTYAILLTGLAGVAYAALDRPSAPVRASGPSIPVSTPTGATAWPTLPGSEADRFRELPVRVSSPRGALRLDGVDPDVRIELEPLRELGVPRLVSPDFWSTSEAEPFVEFYGLNAGPRRARMIAPGGGSRLLQFTVRAGEITTIGPGAVEQHPPFGLGLESAGAPISAPASLHLLGETQDSIRSWRGSALELSSAWGLPTTIGVRFRTSEEGGTVRAGGRFAPEVGPDALTVQVPEAGRDLQLDWSLGSPTTEPDPNTVTFARYGNLAGSPLEIDLVQEAEFELPAFSFTHLELDAPGDEARITHLGEEAYRLGVGFSGPFGVRLWSRVEADSVALNETAPAQRPARWIAEMEGPEVDGVAVVESASGNPITRAVLLGPWRKPMDPNSPAAFGRAGSAEVWSPTPGPYPQTAPVESRTLDWHACEELLGLDPSGLGIAELSVRALPDGAPTLVRTDTPATLQLAADAPFEISGTSAGVRIWGWFEGPADSAPHQHSGEPHSESNAPRVRLQDLTGEGLHGVQLEACRIEWLDGRSVQLDFSLLRPSDIAVVGGSTGAPEAFSTHLRNGDVLVIHHD